MKKPTNNRQNILFVVLAILTIFYIIDSGMFSNGNAKTPVKNIAKSLSGDENVTDLDDIHRIIELASVTEVNWNNGWNNDPFFYVSLDNLNSKDGFMDGFFGTATEGTNIEGLILTGISWRGNSGFAIINGQIAKVDDVIKGHRVEKITINHVVLKRGSKTIRLSLDDS